MPSKRRKIKKRNNDGDASVNILEYSHRDGEQPQDTAKKQRQQLELLNTGDHEITCSSFGQDRNIKFPYYHFCTPCKNWDNRPMKNKRLNQRMKNYKCKIKHTSHVVPGEKRKEWQP